MKKLRLTIDGKEVAVEEGKTVLDAIKKAEIYVPTLCYHPYLSPYGGCRLCIVQIEGMRGYPTSCTTPASDGMKVVTINEEIQNLRREVVKLLLTEHPNACLICTEKDRCIKYQGCIRKVGVTTGCRFCPKDQQCEFQDVVEYVGIKEVDLPFLYRDFTIEREDPFFDRDYNLCILCNRCVRVCHEIRGAGVLNFVNRGNKTIVGTAFNMSHIEANCQFCGACVDVCPTGSLIERASKWAGVPEKSVKSICALCSIGCVMDFKVKSGKVISVVPDMDGEVNKGQACVKGRFTLPLIIHSPKRLLHPMIRRNGNLQKVSWEVAINFISENLEKYKGNKFGFITSTNLTNEDNFVIRKFVKEVMKSGYLEFTQGFSYASSLKYFENENKPLLFKNSIEDVSKFKTIFVVGPLFSKSFPIISLEIKKASRNGSRLILINNEETGLINYAYETLKIKSGSEIAFFIGLMKSALKNGNINERYFLKLKNSELIKSILEKVSRERIEKSTGINFEKIEEISGILFKSPDSLLFYEPDLIQNGFDTENIKILMNLAISSGAVLFPLVVENNFRGSFDMGVVSEFYHRNKAGDFSEVKKKIKENEIKCLYLAGEFQLQEKSGIEFLVIQDIFPSELSEFADVILPAASFAEIEGTYTNVEGRVQLLSKVIEPVGEAKPDWWIISEISEKMGATGFDYKNSEEIMEEISSQIKLYKNISYKNLREKGSAFINLPSFSEVLKKSQLFEINPEKLEEILSTDYLNPSATEENKENSLYRYRNVFILKESKSLERVVRGKNV
ncbi:MAG: molybdopterin-dependent oxidoreductase [Acidobacteriota bacterium]